MMVEKQKASRLPLRVSFASGGTLRVSELATSKEERAIEKNGG